MVSYKTGLCPNNVLRPNLQFKVCKDLFSIIHHFILFVHVVFALLLVRLFSCWVSVGFDAGVRNVNTFIVLYNNAALSSYYYNNASLAEWCHTSTEILAYKPLFSLVLLMPKIVQIDNISTLSFYVFSNIQQSNSRFV